MKRKYYLLFLLCLPCVLTVAAEPDWQSLRFGNNIHVYDMANITMENGLVTYWVLNTSPQVAQSGGSQKIKFGIDCHKNLFSMLGFISYSEPEARGEIVTRRDTPSKTTVNKQILPNTPGMEMRDYFCAKVRR